MSTRGTLLFFAALSLIAAASACPRNCGSGKICISWRGVISRCVAKPPPNPACSCIALFQPVCCEVRIKRGWFFTWKGKFQASNACQCGCRSGTVCSGSAPANPPIGCTKERVPVCCKVGTNAPRTAANKCVCTKRLRGTIISQGECVAAPSPVKPLTDAVCPAVFDPVCCSIPGDDTPRTVSNSCVCKSQRLGTVEAVGECGDTGPTGPTICTQEYDPVCCKAVGAAKPITVSNKCTCGKGTVVPDSECNPADPPATPPGGAVLCSFVYKPVCCKINGKTETASNKCVCTNQKSGTVESTGECSGSTAPGPICPAVIDPVCCLPKGKVTTVTKDNECLCGDGRVIMKGKC